MKAILGLLMVSLVFVAQEGAFCHDGSGGLTLEPQLSTRAIALGETGLVETGSAEGFAVNVSCLPFLESIEAGLGHGSLIRGISSSATFVSVALPFGTPEEYPGGDDVHHKYGVGLAIDHRGYDLAQGSGWSSETVSLGFGYAMAPYASVGVLSKMLFSSSDIEDAGVKAYGIDIGSRVALSPRIDLGVVIRNLGGKAAWNGGEDEAVPVVMDFGGAVIVPYDIRAEVAVSVVSNGGNKVGFGLDVPLMETGFHLRGGYLHRSGDYSRNILTGGFGFRHLRYRLGYAVRIDEDAAFGVTHYFSLGGGLR